MRLDLQISKGRLYVAVEMTNLRKYRKLGLLNRVVSVDEAELRLEKRGWWSVAHFEQKFAAESDARVKGVEGWPMVSVR